MLKIGRVKLLEFKDEVHSTRLRTVCKCRSVSFLITASAPNSPISFTRNTFSHVKVIVAVIILNKRGVVVGYTIMAEGEP